MDQSSQARMERAREAEPEDEADDASVFSPEQKAAFRYQTPAQYDEAGPSNVDYQNSGYQQDWQGYEAGNSGYEQGAYDDGSGVQGYY